MGLVRTIAPTLDPVTLAEAKTHSRVTISEDDAYITAIISAARGIAEQKTKRAFNTQTWKLTMDRWPEHGKDIILPWPPLQSVTSVTYVDTDGTTQTWSSSSYVVDTASTPGRIRLAYNEVYPSARVAPNSITIIFKAGYGDAATDVPDEIRHYIKILTGHFYDNREPVVTGTVAAPIPYTLDFLLGPYRVLGAST